MKKILFGILAVFMSFALAYGTACVVDQTLSTSTEISEDQNGVVSAIPTERWIDIVNYELDDKSNPYGRFTRYGGRTLHDSTGKLISATIPAGLANETYNGTNSKANGKNCASLALAAFALCTREFEVWRSVTLNIACDINMSGHSWEPIGTAQYPFKGTFNGNGHRILGTQMFYESIRDISSPNSRARLGFFGFVYNATIKDFSISGGVNLQQSGNASVTYGDIGVIAYAQNCKVFNVINEAFIIECNRFNSGNGALVSGISFFDMLYIGGIVGYAEGTEISGCKNERGQISYIVNNGASSRRSHRLYIGGICGYLYNSSCLKCASYAMISMQNPTTAQNHNDNFSNFYVGGLVGFSKQDGNKVTTVEDCTFGGKIASSGQFWINVAGAFVGGIVAYNEGNGSMQLTNCHNYGEISFANTNKLCVGGVLARGNATLTISQCSNYGNITVTATAGEFVNNVFGFGGILGCSGQENSSSTQTTISNCVNYGEVSITGAQDVKYVGGIAGHIWDKGYIRTSMNYGNITGKECVGGIAGELGIERFGYYGGSLTDVGVTNCINYGLVKSATEEYCGQIVGYMTAGPSKLSYCYATSLARNYIRLGYSARYIGNYENNSFIVREENVKGISIDSLSAADFIESANWSTSYKFSCCTSLSGSGTWLLSSVASNYLNKAWGSHYYSWVLKSSVATFDIEVQWKKDGDRDYDDVDFANFSDFASFQSSNYDSIDKMRKSVEYNPAKIDSKPQYLCGAKYTEQIQSPLVMVGNSNFTLERAGNNWSFDIDQHSYLKVADKNNVLKTERLNLESVTSVSLNKYITFQLSPNVYSSDVTTTLVFRFTNEGKDVKIVQTSGSGYESKGAVSAQVNGKTATIEADELKGLHYKDTVMLKVRPKVGFYCDKITLYIGSQTRDIVSNESEKSKIGFQTFTFSYNFEDKIAVHYSYVEYTVKVYFEEFAASVNGATTVKDAGVTHSQVTGFHKSYGGYDTCSSLTLSGLDFGYRYKIQIAGNSYYLKTNLDPDKNNQITLTADDLIGSEYNQMRDITTDVFTVVVTREPIEYRVEIDNFADSFESFDATNSTIGGEVSTTLPDITANQKLVFEKREKPGYKLSNFYMYSAQRTSKGNISLSTTFFDSNNTLTLSMQELVNDWIKKYYSEEDNPQQAWFDDGNTIYVSARFRLGSYKLQVSAVSSNLDGSTENLTEQCTVEIDGFFSTVSGTGTSYVKYFAPVKLTAPAEEDGLRFVGFYNGDDLLSLNFTYNFLVDPKIKEIENLEITARYEEFSTTTKTAFASYDGTTNMYKIENADDLLLLSQKVHCGETFENVMFVQTANIDMSGLVFNPIGTSAPFKGVYDGGNYTISNLKFVGSGKLSNVGLFGYISGATIKNLTVQNAEVSGYANVGALVGIALNSTFEKVNNYQSNITVYDVTFKKVVYLGYSDGCIESYDIARTWYYHEGGTLTGVETDPVSNTFAGRENFGGLVGKAENCTFYACSSRAEVNFYNRHCYASGLVGSAKRCKIDQCFVVGKTNDSNSFGKIAVFLEEENITECFYRESDSSANTYYFKKNDDSLWIKINGRDNLKVFYWS